MLNVPFTHFLSIELEKPPLFQLIQSIISPNIDSDGDFPVRYLSRDIGSNLLEDFPLIRARDADAAKAGSYLHEKNRPRMRILGSLESDQVLWS
jgi:hypothetical protein